MSTLKFESDEKRNAANRYKHCISFTAAKSAFLDEKLVTGVGRPSVLPTERRSHPHYLGPPQRDLATRVGRLNSVIGMIESKQRQVTVPEFITPAEASG